MRIHDIDPYLVRVGSRNQLLVRVRLDDGRVGWGESGYTTREGSVVGALDDMRDWLVGRDPRRRDALFQEMTRGGYCEGGRSLTAAAAAIDIALHDVVARAYEIPVYELLGGAHRDRITCYASLPPPYGDTSTADARQLVAAGWRCVRVMVAHPMSAGQPFDPVLAGALAADWLPELRAAVTDRTVLGLHGHHRLTPFEAVSLLARLPPGTIDYIEEPIRSQSPAAYEALRARTNIPFAVGAEFPDKWAYASFLDRGLLDFARVDVGLMGLTEAKKVAAMAETRYVDIMPHNALGPIATTAALHLSAAVPNMSYFEIRESPVEHTGFYDRTIFPNSVLPCDDGTIPLPTAPGLGVQVDEERLNDRPPATRYEAPHWSRVDGTYTNW